MQISRTLGNVVKPSGIKLSRTGLLLPYAPIPYSALSGFSTANFRGENRVVDDQALASKTPHWQAARRFPPLKFAFKNPL